jgi:AcrR family transcriptional regulator
MKGEERRAAILEASVQLFAEKGFRGATTRELASALQVSEPVLYQHFPTKRDLYLAILEEKARQGNEAYVELSRMETQDDGVFFTSLGNLILERYEKDPCFIRLLLYSALEGHEVSEEFFHSYLSRFYQMVTGYIGARIDAGAFRPVDPAVAARAFIGMISNHGLVRLLYGDVIVKAGRKRVVQEMVSLFLNGITNPGAPGSASGEAAPGL